MAVSRVRIGLLVLVTLLVAGRAGAAGGSYDTASVPARAGYTALAAIANVVPGVSALYAPSCLPGYVVCKAIFAVVSTVAAADQLVLSGGGDLEQTRGILYRGFAGDWILTGRHVAGDIDPRPLPDPPPPTASGGGGAWQPPPR